MYKAFNTFIDDIFAFIITMPTAHRVACFRDDLIFIVYLYQRWWVDRQILRVISVSNLYVSGCILWISLALKILAMGMRQTNKLKRKKLTDIKVCT